MKISKQTTEILKNFATINSNWQAYSGKEQRTVSVNKTIVSSANINEEFPKDFAIWDMKQFLDAMNLMKDPDLSFEDNYVIMSEGKQNIKYRYCNSDMINIATISKDKKLDIGVDIQFELSQNILEKILSGVSILKSEYITIEGDGENLSVKTYNKEDVNASAAEIIITETDKTFKLILKVDNIKVIPGDYIVQIDSNKKWVKFISKDRDQFYLTPGEKDSVFN